MRLPARNLKPAVHLETPLGLPTRPFSLFSRTTSVEQDRALGMPRVLCEGRPASEHQAPWVPQESVPTRQAR